MLRECHRVLERGGRLVAAAIELAEGLGDEALLRALALGPADVEAEASLAGMVERVGFEIMAQRDVTPEFRDGITRRLEALASNEDALRLSEGGEAVDAERDKRSRMLTGVNEGLLRRTIVVGRAR